MGYKRGKDQTFRPRRGRRAKQGEALRSSAKLGRAKMPSEDVKWPKRLPPLITFSTWFFSTNTSHLGALAESMVVQTPDGFAKKPRTVRSLLGFILSFFFAPSWTL